MLLSKYCIKKKILVSVAPFQNLARCLARQHPNKNEPSLNGTKIQTLIVIEFDVSMLLC